MVETINIAGREVGKGRPCFIIAEAGVNHNGDLDMAKSLVDAAANAGADAVKFQSFVAEHLALKNAPKALYQIAPGDKEESQFDMLSRLELSAQSHEELVAHCKKRGIVFLSSPFDEQSADLLFDLGVPAYKLGSGEITNLSFLSYIAKKNKPMLISTGMAGLGEVEAALNIAEEAGNGEIALLHCTSAYPADPKDANLRVIQTMRSAFNLPIGYSDHTLGFQTALAAIALGACVLEKHFTLDRDLPGPDHKASIEQDELSALVTSVRIVESALGDGRKRAVESEAATALAARKSLVAAVDIPKGATLTEEMIAIKRPGTGLPPAMRPILVGLTVRRSITAGTMIDLEMLS